MKTIVVANQKGGVAKTTVSKHLGWYAAGKLKLRTVVVDFDTEGHMTTSMDGIAELSGLSGEGDWLTASGLFKLKDKRLPRPCSERLSYVGADTQILDVAEKKDLSEEIKIAKKRFEWLAQNFDVCVIDTGHGLSTLLVAALAVADFAVSPWKPDRDARAGLLKFFNAVSAVKNETKLNPELAPLGILPSLVRTDRSYHKEKIDELREAVGDLVLPVTLYDRAATDLAKDRPVWRTDRGESRSLAAREMLAVCKNIYGLMGL